MLSTVLALALLASPQAVDSTQDKKPEESTQKVEKKAEDERICRYIRGDMNSRRKKKVCLTKEQWQDVNQGN